MVTWKTYYEKKSFFHEIQGRKTFINRCVKITVNFSTFFDSNVRYLCSRKWHAKGLLVLIYIIYENLHIIWVSCLEISLLKLTCSTSDFYCINMLVF